MIIRLSKKGNRNSLICIREDGSFTQSEMGQQTPFHDIAHYVADKKLNIQNGFYCNVKKGYSIQQLSDKEVIKTLDKGAMVSELFARALGSLITGSCTLEQFIPLVKAELTDRYQIPMPFIREEIVTEMEREYKKLLEQWQSLPDGGNLEMEF
jgi:hypothetical protein